MTQRISRLKDDIDTKALQIVAEEEKKKNYAKENDVLQKDIDKIKRNINSSDEMIKTQEADIARLKYVISEAEAEKQK